MHRYLKTFGKVSVNDADVSDLRLEYLGEFETDSAGELLVTDPCYTIGTWCSGVIKVKPGKYKSYVIRGTVDGWGERSHALVIVHESASVSGHKYINLGAEIGVDSGQAGFFNRKQYRLDLIDEVPLIGEKENCLKNNLFKMEDFSLDGLSLAKFRKIISENVSDEELQILLDDNKKELEKEKARIKEEMDNIDPDTCRKSRDFYDICCSLTLGNLGAGVEKFGAVSSSGFGDGSYTCFINDSGEIVVSFIEFIGEDENE